MEDIETYKICYWFLLYFIYTFSGATTAGLVVTGIATTGSLVTVGKAGPTAG